MTPGSSYLRRMLDSDLIWQFRQAPAAMLAAAVLVLMMICAVAAPLIAPHTPFDPGTLNLMDSRLPPAWVDGGSATYLLGTDEQGRDVLSTIFYGMRISLAVGVAAVLLSVTIGVTLGLIAGWFGGWIDAVIMRMGDVQLSFPTIMIAFFIDGIAKAVMPPDLREMTRFSVVILAIGLADWVQFARTVRAATMIEKNKDYTAAARLSQVSSLKIVFAHILPNTLWCRDPDRGDPVLSGPGDAAHAALARRADPGRQRPALVRRMVDIDVPRPCSGLAGPFGQHLRRLAPECPEPASQVKGFVPCPIF